MSVVPLPPAPLPTAGPSSHARSGVAHRSKDFDVVAAYRKALGNHSVSTFHARRAMTDLIGAPSYCCYLGSSGIDGVVDR
jgi:hypothetical protein